MITIDFVQLAIALACATITLIGWGLITAKVLMLPTDQVRMAHIWIGLFVVVLSLEILHLFLPINWVICSFYLLVGVCGVFFKSPSILASQIKGKLTVSSVIFWGIFTLLFVSWMLIDMLEPTNYDSGLYHFNSIRWINEYPTVLGLANLHSRFGYNQSWFLFLALLNFFPIWGKGYAAGGLFLILASVCTVFENLSKKSLATFMAFCVFTIAIVYNLKYISSPSPDVPNAVLQVIITIYIYKAIFVNEEMRLKKLDVIAGIFLCALLITIKLSGLIFSITAALIFASVLKKFQDKRLAICLFIGVFIAAATHALNGYMLTGFPFYPSSIGRIDFPWALSPINAQNERNAIYCWARAPGPDCLKALGNWSWFYPWLMRAPRSAIVLLILSFAGLIFCSSRSLVRKTWKADRNIYALILPSILGLIFWFVTAPEWRFARALPLILFATFLLYTLDRWKPPIFKIKWYGYAKWGVLVILVGATLANIKLMSDGYNDSCTFCFRPIHQAHLGKITIKSGLTVYYPIDSDQCYESPLPCAPSVSEESSLKLESSDSHWPRLRFTTE